MTKGQLVEARYLPAYGTGVIEEVTHNNRLLVTFEIDGKPYMDVFDAHELRLAKPTLTRI